MQNKNYCRCTVITCHHVKPCSACGAIPILVVNRFQYGYGAYVHCPNDCHVTPMRHAERVMGRGHALERITREAMDDWNGRRFL